MDSSVEVDCSFFFLVVFGFSGAPDPLPLLSLPLLSELARILLLGCLVDGDNCEGPTTALSRALEGDGGISNKCAGTNVVFFSDSDLYICRRVNSGCKRDADLAESFKTLSELTAPLRTLKTCLESICGFYYNIDEGNEIVLMIIRKSRVLDTVSFGKPSWNLLFKLDF